MQRALVGTTEDLSEAELVQLTLETGKFSVDVMALLDKAIPWHTETLRLRR